LRSPTDKSVSPSKDTSRLIEPGFEDTTHPPEILLRENYKENSKFKVNNGIEEDAHREGIETPVSKESKLPSFSKRY